MVSVFISHSSRDNPFVRQLADFLALDAGIKVVLDDQIGYGQNVVTKITKALDSSDFVLLVLSPDSLTSPWVEAEYSDALWAQTSNRTENYCPCSTGTAKSHLSLGP